MLLVERLIHKLSPHSHSHAPLPTSASQAEGSSHVEFDADVELGELEREEGIAQAGRQSSHFGEDAADTARVYPLTLGLMVHALAEIFAAALGQHPSCSKPSRGM